MEGAEWDLCVASFLFLRENIEDTQTCRTNPKQGDGQEAWGFLVLNLVTSLHLEHSSFLWYGLSAFLGSLPNTNSLFWVLKQVNRGTIQVGPRLKWALAGPRRMPCPTQQMVSWCFQQASCDPDRGSLQLRYVLGYQPLPYHIQIRKQRPRKAGLLKMIQLVTRARKLLIPP